MLLVAVLPHDVGLFSAKRCIATVSCPSVCNVDVSGPHRLSYL